MTLAWDALMSGHGAMGDMKLVDCLTSGAMHDGLLAAGTTLIADGPRRLFSAWCCRASPATLARMDWFCAICCRLPPPLDPRGERL
jgi:hypothetical protein